jgi:hypothetical protein
MELYHTTSGAKMKQEIAQHYHMRLVLAQTKVAIPPSGGVWAQLQRDVLRLHRFPYDRYQIRIQTFQVRRFARRQ